MKIDPRIKKMMLEERLHKIESRPDSFKTPGVMRKIKRQLRKI